MSLLPKKPFYAYDRATWSMFVSKGWYFRRGTARGATFFLTISISGPISATRKEPVCKISGQKEGILRSVMGNSFPGSPNYTNRAYMYPHIPCIGPKLTLLPCLVIFLNAPFTVSAAGALVRKTLRNASSSRLLLMPRSTTGPC